MTDQANKPRWLVLREKLAPILREFSWGEVLEAFGDTVDTVSLYQIVMPRSELLSPEQIDDRLDALWDKSEDLRAAFSSLEHTLGKKITMEVLMKIRAGCVDEYRKTKPKKGGV